MSANIETKSPETVQNAAYGNLQDNITALNQAFVTHVRKTDAEMQKMEKTMEHKTMRTSDVNIDSRLSQLEQGLRSVFSHSNNVGEDSASSMLRALGNYMKTGKVESKTIGTVDADGGLLLNKPVSQELWHRICLFPLIENVKKIDAKGKLLKLIIDDANKNDYAKWSKDGYNPANDTVTPVLKAIEISTNTCCASTTVTRDFLDDMDETALQAWIQGSLAESFGAKITWAILAGTADKSLEGIMSYHQSNPNKITEVALKDDRLLESLLAMISKMDVRHINKSAWYMSVPCFTQIMKTLLSEHNTQFVEMLKMVTSSDHTYGYTLLGKPVYIVPEMPMEYPIMLADMTTGYYLVQHENGNYKRSEAYELDAVRYGYRMRVGGKVVDPTSFVIGAPAVRDNEAIAGAQ